MNLPSNNPAMTDDDIMDLARRVEDHDFERIAPPAQVWNNIQAEFEVEVAAREAAARRRPSHFLPSGWSSARILSAAAATLLMVGVAVAVVTLRSDDNPVTELAAAAMTDLGLQVPTDETADAVFACDDDGCFVEVDLTALPDSGGEQLELWVINADVSDMYSLGVVESDSGRFDLPLGVTADEFPIVDISVEPDDGDPTHSGQSVLRGVFEQA